MDTTANRTGAVWVAGTGAFLLLAATALFVAVRWDDLPDAAKLGVVGLLTGGFLLGGRALARTLPATGDVLFHLGALLIPIDVAAVAVRLGLGWRGLLLAEGLAAGGAVTILAAATGSVVLVGVAAAAPIAVAAGLAAVSPVPAPLLLALAAAVASVVAPRVAEGQERGSRAGWLAVAWAAVAGLGPMLGAVAADVLADGSHVGVGVLTELGMAGRATAWAAMASGAIAAVVLGREAKAQGDRALGGVAVAVFFAGVATAGVAGDLSTTSNVLALPGLFVAVEAATLVARRDAFWGRIAARTALLAEVPAVVFGWTTALWWFAVSPITNNVEFFGARFGGEPLFGVALGLLAVGWFLMGARRLSADTDDSDTSLLRSMQAAAAEYSWLVAPAVVGAVAWGTASGPATAAACVALGALLATAPRRSARLIAGVLALWAPLTMDWSWAAVSAGLAGAAVATLAARHAHRASGEAVNPETVVLTLAAIGTALLGCAIGSVDGGIVVNSMLAVAACCAVAAALEPAPVVPLIARGGAVAAALGVAVIDPDRALAALTLATVLAVVDAVGRDRPVIALGAAATMQLVVVDLARRGGLDTAETGLALCISAVVWAGLALVVDERWRLPLLAAAGAGLIGGLMLAAHDPRAHAHALLIAGGLVAVGGVAIRKPAVVGVGAGIVCVAIGSHLELSHVRATDAYMAPVAALLLGAGFHLRRSGDDPVSSWLAYTPPVALLGGAALVERIAGGAGVHALVAGAVGIAAVAAGGGRRLAGPLITGTALLVAVTVHESLGTLATVPTWGWLAAGGSLLLTVGVSLERRGVSDPLEAGRRLVDVVAERFS